jgi:hypothetical protein
MTDLTRPRDGMTAGESPLVARDPSDPTTIHFSGLSFTHAKNLPDMGMEVAEIMNGNEANPSHAWSLEQSSGPDNQPLLHPRGTFQELNEKAKGDPRVTEWQKEHPNWKE